ncbi:FAD-dependent monooxygenase [Phytomonospora endophytica]|uniref:2-polyprenyl-6-methoxyphenol hydroxylase-like FAD-dependent oxidoreductase n=1 Tax=Phytomonospora endophytica TaxID=714109 RepID=A0A841FZP2_9ACTN|nr:FAD-dependent monooxygenase [Phytomonospora endophytica]MBB6038857.1 2-polyprenyl-6-methoxyphenol hydroxylase-like FAD-dependent oxidoreductase [Phytomonospora endophytica]GIG68348.1 FAD-dependent oxidoreductase [Phytomonospora endophytica]
MDTDVVIAGGGPNGLMLACELALAGIRPLVLERLAEPSREPKANGLLGQVVRLMDQRGLFESLSGGDGPPSPNRAYFMFGALPLDLSVLDDSPLYALPAPQHHIVRVLDDRARELGVPVLRGHEVTGLSQDDDAVTVTVTGPDGPYTLRARHLVGADGAHSVTRKLAGIEFPGVSYDRATVRSAHASLPAAWINPGSGALNVPGHGPVLPFLPHRTERGGFSYAPLPGHPPLISTTEWEPPATTEPMTLAEMRASVARVLGADLPLEAPPGEGPHVLRRLAGGNTRIAERFRDRRVFLVGDAAHVYAAGGGPGLNLGLQDAVNLGWKLAAALDGRAPDGLLDTYETERRLAAERMVMNARAQSALIAPGPDVTGMRELFTELLGDPATVGRLAALTAGADVRYAITGEHPLTGTFAPDLALETPDGPTRLAELARSARPLLLDLTSNGSLAAALTEPPVDVVTASAGPDAPTALLLRPDGYVAWASSAARPDPAELEKALGEWFTAAPADGRRDSRAPGTSLH